MYIQQGEYAKAVSAFGNASTNNAALAQMLVNNNDKAISILNNVSEKMLQHIIYWQYAVLVQQTTLKFIQIYHKQSV